MDSPLENPAIRYGMGLSSAAILAFVAFTYLDGAIRWIVLGLAVFETVFVPLLLKKAVAQESA